MYCLLIKQKAQQCLCALQYNYNYSHLITEVETSSRLKDAQLIYGETGT